MTVRVTRLMEYEYVTVEQALTSMDAWAVPANGTRQFGVGSSPKGTTIRSAVIGPVFGEIAERIHTALAVDETDPDHSVEREDALELLTAVSRAWRAMDQRERSAVRRWSENLYDVLGRAATWVVTNAPGE